MNYALITGASRGIGKSIAEQLAAKGNNLLLISRSEETLMELKKSIVERYKVHVEYLAIDLSSPDSAAQIYNWYTTKEYKINILVNNAGYGIWGVFETLSIQSQLEMLQINMLTVVQLTHTLLPELKTHANAYILNVASTAAYQAVPTLSLYAASKSFVLSFTRGIRLELQGTGVSVSCLCPGPTSTDFVIRAGMSDEIKKKSETFGMSSEDVAVIGIKGMYKGTPEIIPGLLNKIIVLITAFVPKYVTEKIAKNLYKR